MGDHLRRRGAGDRDAESRGRAHDAAAYQDVDAAAASACSEPTAAVKVSAGTGPSAVRRVELAAVAEGLEVRWSSAATRGSQLAQFRVVVVVKDGEQAGSAYTAGDVRSAVLPGATADGPHGVSVVATAAAGGSTWSTAVVEAAR